MSEAMDTGVAPPPSYEQVVAEDEAKAGGSKIRLTCCFTGEDDDVPSSQVDIAFLMDCTGSMDPYIKSTKQNIEGIAYRLKQTEGCDVQFALVQYRDHPPQERTYIVRGNNFTNDPKRVVKWLDKARASGGGDQPEAVADALHYASTLSWRKGATKICVLITDAPPHGLDRNLYDCFTGGCPKGHDPVELVNDLAERGVSLYCIGCEPCISKWKHFYIALAHMAGGRYLPLSRVDLIPDIIVGGAREEISLRAIEARADNLLTDIAAAAEGGEELSEDELAAKLVQRLKKDKVTTTQMKAKDANNQILGALPDDAHALLQCSQLAQVKAIFIARRYKDERRGGRMRRSCSRSPSYSGSRSRSRSRSRSLSLSDSSDDLSMDEDDVKERCKRKRKRKMTRRSRSRSRRDSRSRSRSISGDRARARRRERDRERKVRSRSRSMSAERYSVTSDESVDFEQAKRLITWSRKKKA